MFKCPVLPCERAFSSSKEINTNHRSSLGAEFIEVLQMYKYLVRGHRLDFTKGMLATEEECVALDISPSTLDNLLISGNIEALEAIISSSY
ncbi:hypothetical protein BDN70DRAFT_820134 [Pholiota conissans]|uniref:HAT C-terminal dimerisation domain-containing protein n=1 Tax=Pholiota conissans TaxID=109636 RepID=A0A9P5YM46_9AGAR|nr:hypothetical protein BDN70DRAFT_820134 [Pholiota conissans]